MDMLTEAEKREIVSGHLKNQERGAYFWRLSMEAAFAAGDQVGADACRKALDEAEAKTAYYQQALAELDTPAST